MVCMVYGNCSKFTEVKGSLVVCNFVGERSEQIKTGHHLEATRIGC